MSSASIRLLDDLNQRIYSCVAHQMATVFSDAKADAHYRIHYAR